MNNLVITVSLDSSIELLKPFADIVILDKDTVTNVTAAYETVYIRSHFSRPDMSPQRYRSEIEAMVKQTKQLNSKVRFIDDMDTVDAIVAFEDKWLQYNIFNKFMPKTELYDESFGASTFTHPVFKKRLSSRGNGVTWDEEPAKHSAKDWIIQESLSIVEELRIYAICGEVYEVGAVRRTMTAEQNTRAIHSRTLTQDEIDFSRSVIAKAPSLDLVGLDVAHTSDGKLWLMEVNRSPGFARFNELTNINLARVLYEKPHAKRVDLL